MSIYNDTSQNIKDSLKEFRKMAGLNLKRKIFNIYLSFNDVNQKF